MFAPGRTTPWDAAARSAAFRCLYAARAAAEASLSALIFDTGASRPSPEPTKVGILADQGRSTGFTGLSSVLRLAEPFVLAKPASRLSPLAFQSVCVAVTQPEDKNAVLAMDQY